MNKTGPKDFYINAVISSKSQKFPGVLFVAACADISLFGNMSVHTSNTCENKKIITGRSNSRSMYEEYQSFFSYTKKKISLANDSNKKAVLEKMNWFIDTLEKFMTELDNFVVKNEVRPSGLTRVIYPSDKGEMLGDLKENLIGKMKPWALSSSGKDDCDRVELITDDKGMNVAKLNGAEKLEYKNGSGLVAWMPTGTQLQVLTKKLNSLLGYTSGDLIARSEYFFSYVLQTFMNVIFVNNPNLSELDKNTIVSNYKMLLENIRNKNPKQFESYEHATDNDQKEKELEQPIKFIEFLLKQICKETSLQNLDLRTGDNQKKYIDFITAIASLLCNAQHPNQVLVEQWMESVLAMGDAFCGKNYVLYLPLYKILQRFISLNLFEFQNNDDKAKFEQMLHFMVNLSGKFRFKKTQFDLSGTKVQEKYEFGAQITTKEKYRVSTEYDTDISFEYFQELTQKIIEFEEFEKKIRAENYKLNDDDMNKIIEYLKDGRYFYDDVIEKILKDKVLLNKFIKQAEKVIIDDKECFYKSAYEILVNDYFDLFNKYNCIDKTLLSRANLIKYFNNDERKSEIIDFDAKLVVELELFDKLDTKTINGFLKDEAKKSKMLEILKLVIGKIETEKLNELDFDNFDEDLLNAVVLSRVNDISRDKIKKIDFKKLKVDAQKLLFKKMADNNFKDFDFDVHWTQVSLEVFKSASIEEWRKFVFEKMPMLENSDDNQKINQEIINKFCNRQDILKLMPVNILSLFDTRNPWSQYTFFDFFDACFNYWSTEQILTFGRCRNERKKQKQEKELQDYTLGTRTDGSQEATEKSKTKIKNQLDQLIEKDLKELKEKIKKDKIQLEENALSTFISLQSFFQKIKDEYKDYHVRLKEILLKFFKTHLLDNKNNKDNINQCIKYLFSNCQSNYFLAMIIMEEFILSNGEVIDKNNDDKALSEISEKIKCVLNWDDEVTRKGIIKNLFQFIPKINELMCACDKQIVAKSLDRDNHKVRFVSLVNIYKSFFNKILSLYSNDIDKDDVKKIQVYFLENSETIKQFCRICGDRVHIDCFSEILDSVNSAEDITDITKSPDKMHKFKKINSILKIIDVADSIKEIEKESFDLDPDDSIGNFMLDIKRTALLICFGYPTDQPGNSIKTHLSQYNKKDGKFDFAKSDSFLCGIFKDLCDKQIEIDKFITPLDSDQKTQLTEIISLKNSADKFSKFEEFILPLIENDYKNMDFVAFVQKYYLPKNAIGVENIDNRMINIAYDCVKGNLSFKEFINKYYVLQKNENEISENKIINQEIHDYHIEGLKDKASQKILTEILINDQDTGKIISDADNEIIKKLYKNLLPKNKNSTKEKEKEMKEMRRGVKQYIDGIKNLKSAKGTLSYDTPKLAKILFSEEESDAEIKAGKFKTMIDAYTKENRSNWENFAEIYILRHISQKNMQQYIKFQPQYNKILDLNAQAANLKDVVQAFYRKVNNIDLRIKMLNDCYSDINSFLEYPCLFDIQKKVMEPDFVDNFKTLLQRLIEISEMYASDEAVEICKKYEYLIQDDIESNIKKFFSSMVKFVHFIKDYRKLAKILLIDMYKESAGSEEEKISELANSMFGGSLKDCYSNSNFTFKFVYCLDELEEILKLTYQEYKKKKAEDTKEISKDEYSEKKQALQEIYNKYKKYGNRFFRPRDVEIMCQKSDKDKDSDFQKDFNLVIETLQDIGFLKENNVFTSCVNKFKEYILEEYEKGFESGTTLEKFINLGYQQYFSDEQIYNLGVMNRFDSENNETYTPNSVIKKLPKIASDESPEKLDKASKNLSLRPGDKLDYIIASVNSGAICTDTMRKLFWHMDYRKLKTFVGDYSFKDFNKKGKANNIHIASFGVHLQNILIDAFGYKSFEFKSKKADKKDKDINNDIENVNEKNTLIEYNKMSVSQKFIFGECFFGGMFRSIYQINKFKKINQEQEEAGRNPRYYDEIYNIDIEKELDELINKIKSRVLSICQNPSAIKQTNKNKLALIKAMPNKKSFNASLEELIARAFLSAHIYAYSGHIDGNEYDQSLLNFGNDVFDKIISMLSRSTEHDKFQSIDDIKKWVDESSLKYFIRGTFNFKEIPENELSSHQMELEQNNLIAKYNARILNHILSKIGDKVSAFEVFEKIYLDDKNKVIYGFDFKELLDLLHEKVVTTVKSTENFLTLLKFLKKVEKTEYISDDTRAKLFNCLLECAKKANVLDKDGKFADKEALTWWIENVMLGNNMDYWSRIKIFMYMADNIGKNISVMDVINILKETDEKNPDIGLAKDICQNNGADFVNYLFGQRGVQLLSTENIKDLSRKKLEDVFYFIAKKMGSFPSFDALLAFLDVVTEKENLISVDTQSGVKKFVSEDSLQTFFGYKIMDIIDHNKDDEDAKEDEKERKMHIELLKFLYAISRIPKDKTLLDVVEKFAEFQKNGNEKIFNNQLEYRGIFFASAVQAIHDCLMKEKNNMNEKNKADYINFLISFFTNIQSRPQIKQNVSEMIGNIFNLFQSQELVKHIDDIRIAFLNNESATSILYSIFCKSIENMGNDDITNGNLLKILEMLESLKNICEFDFNNLKNVLNEKIKTVMLNDKDSQKMANDILSIVSRKKISRISSLLDLSPCLDVLNFENLFVSNNPTQKFFGDLELLTNFIKNGVPTDNTDNKDCNNKWIRFKYAMQRIPKNMTVINALQKIKQNHGDIWNFNFPELPGNLYANDFCKDICSRIQTEVNSMSQDNKKLFETIDILTEFFKKITLLDKKNSKIKKSCEKNWDDIVKNKDKNEESSIVISIIETLKILLSKYKFNNVNDITTFFEQIKKILEELKLDSKENTNIDIFVPTFLSELKNSNLNIFLLLECLHEQNFKEGYGESGVCKRILQNKDMLNKLSDMFKQKVEELEKEEIATVEFPWDVGNNYENSGIVFLVRQFVTNGDINQFQSVVHSALRICCCNITEDKLNIKKCKIVGNGEKYDREQEKREQIVKVDGWLYEFFLIFHKNTKLTDYQLAILQKMALEYLIDTLGKDIKIFDVLNKLIDETENLGKYNIGANDKVDEATTLSKERSQMLVDKILSEKFPEEKKIKEEKEIKIFEADKKIRFASKFVRLMRFKIDANEETRLFDKLRKQKKEQKLKYEEDEKKKEEEDEKKKEEEEKRRKEEEENKKKKEKENVKKYNENNNSENQKDTKINTEPKKDINKNNKQKEKNEINIIDRKSNNTIEQNMNNNVENTINQNSITEKAKQIENPINKKNILIKALAWFLSFVFVSLCIYFFIQAAITNALITLILTIIFVVASILLTIYLPNKKEQDINKIEMPLNEKNDMHIDLSESPNRQNQQIQKIEQNK